MTVEESRHYNFFWQHTREGERGKTEIIVWTLAAEVPAAYHPTLCENQPPRGHQKQFVRLQPNVDAFKFSFLPRTVVDWNNLDEKTISSDSIRNFKN